MSIYGVGGSSGSSGNNIQRPGNQFPVRDNSRTPAQKPAQSVPPSVTQTPAAAAPQQAVPVEPPPGTDPALWSVLSGEERAFFAKAGAMGPLTYGRALQDMKSSQLPASRGGRLDVKV
ncbi:MAG: hypothetical protein ACREPM_25230 [Gemmatimonadaceae bacterium]